MKPRTIVAAFAAVLSVASVPTPSSASARDQSSARTSKPKVAVTVPGSLVEGDRFTVEVTVARTRGAQRILLQRWTTDVLGDQSWETVKRAQVKGKKRYAFGAVAGASDLERYRARVEYGDAKPSTSKPASTTVWHWTDLSGFDAYYKTSGVGGGLSGAINGTQYRGIFAYLSYPSWEIRYTVGRHCRALRGVLGVSDGSADGSTASISLVADEVTPLLTAATLSPGMDQPFQVDLALPYRLSLQMQKTSASGQTVYPAVGNPEVLCTGLG